MSTPLAALLRVPPSRAEALTRVLERLSAARRVVLTTHINADGDGTGSQAAVAAWLEARGAQATIVNPSPFPDQFRFLLHRPDLAQDWGSDAARAALESADLALVLDTSEAQRIEPLAGLLDPAATVVVDHHLPGRTPVGELCVQEPAAAATGELVYDLLSLAGDAWPDASVLGIYVALVSDTGNFRFSNTTPRTHALAADLLVRGVDPESVFQRLHATVPLRRLRLLRDALGRLEFDARHGISWIHIPQSAMDEAGARGEDFDGILEHARSVDGTRVALLFRDTEQGGTKISFRSNDETDIQPVARRFGGGGHAKASGASVDAPAEEVVPAVLDAVREALGAGG